MYIYIYIYSRVRANPFLFSIFEEHAIWIDLLTCLRLQRAAHGLSPAPSGCVIFKDIYFSG